jgi:hypothetical protein
MGRSYSFECPKCGYRARVSGGADRGVYLQVQTILCRHCKALYDAVVRLKVADSQRSKVADGLRGMQLRKPSVADRPPAFESAVNRLPVEGTRSKWIQFRVRCPVSPGHAVRPWNDPDKCPRCGIYLEKSAVPYRLWD